MNYIVLDLEWNQSYRGKEYSIEETHQAADKAGKSKNQGSFDKKFVRHKNPPIHFILLVSLCCKCALTELLLSGKVG